MNFTLFDLEAEQQHSGHRDRIIDLTASMTVMTASFAFCAIFVAGFLGAAKLPIPIAVAVFLKALVMAGVMIMASAIIANLFEATVVRRINAMAMGIVMAFALVLFNI